MIIIDKDYHNDIMIVNNYSHITSKYHNSLTYLNPLGNKNLIYI